MNDNIEPDDGTVQDLEMSLRFCVNQIAETVQATILERFGKEVTKEEAMALEDVSDPFDFNFPEEMQEGMTQEEYDEARADYFSRIEELRPTFLRLFDLDEDAAEDQLCDLGDPSTNEISRLDAFLIAAFRLGLRM